MLLPSGAWAQDPNAREAVRIAQEAAEDFKAERFLDAAKKFERAFELYQDATLLKNQAVAYYKADVCPKALESAKAYRTFIAAKDGIPEKDKRDVARVTVECEYDAAVRYIETREFALAKASIDDARAAGPTAEMTTKLDELEQELQAARNAPEEDETVVIEDDPLAPRGKSTLYYVGWATLGVGVTLGILTGVRHLIAFGQASDGRDTCDAAGFPNADCADVEEAAYQDWIDGADTIQSLPPIYVLSGAVAAVGLGILIYDYSTQEEESALRLVPAIGTDSAELQLHFRF